MTAKDTARDLVVLKALGDRVRAANETTKHVALDGMDAGDRTAAKLDDGTVIGVVTVAHGRVSATVTDADEVLAWVKKEHPDEVETVPAVERVRPSYLAKLLEHVKKTGEVVPGVDIVEGEPYTVVKVADPRAIAAAWVDGSLPLPTAVLGELEAGQ